MKQVTAFETVAPLASYPPEIVLGEHKQGLPGVIVICEHAASTIPSVFSDLGLDAAARASHIAWDPGAIGVAREVRRLLKGDLVAGTVSRLIYDCNRPPEAESAVPESSEAFLIPGNQKLSELDRRNRWQAVYKPFHEALSEILGSRSMGVVLTIHSFTPIYHGVQRSCEVGILHDFADARLADAILAAVPDGFPFKVERNVPYSANDGVTHTLAEHGVSRGWHSVMVEIRNDLIIDQAQQQDMARHLVALLLETNELKALANA